MSKRFSYSTVGYGVFSLLGERYSMGRIEVFDRENDSRYQVHEGFYCMPFEAADKFQDFMDSLETDLPIHFEIGSVKWCADECAKELGFEDDEDMRNPDKVKAYRRVQNDKFAVEQGYKDWDDLMANSKWTKKDVEIIADAIENPPPPNEALQKAASEYNKKCEYSGLPSVDSYGSVDKEQQAKLLSEVMQADERDGLYDEVEDKTFKQKSKWTKVKRNSSSKYE